VADAKIWDLTMFACSGPGGAEVTARNIAISIESLEVMGGLFGLSVIVFVVFTRRGLFPLLMLGLLILHPACTVSARGGDCGHLQRDASQVFTGFGCIVIIWQVIQYATAKLCKKNPRPN
jgi:hypothetical protein